MHPHPLMKRFRLGWFAALCVVAAASQLSAAEVDVAAEYQAIMTRFHQGVQATKGKSAEVEKERNVALADLLQRAEAAESTEHILLTKAARIGELPEACVRQARLAIERRPRGGTDLVEGYGALLWGLARQQKFDELEQAVVAARREPIHDISMNSLHESIARYYTEFNRPDAAAEHLGQALRCYARLTRADPKYTAGTWPPVSTLEKMCELGIQAAREQRLLETIEEVRASLGGGASDRIVEFQQQLHLKQAVLLHRLGRTDEAERLIADIRDAANRRLQEAPEEEPALLGLADAMELQVLTFRRQRPAAISEYLAFFDKHVREPDRTDKFYETASSAYCQVIAMHRDAGDLPAAEDAANRFREAFSIPKRPNSVNAALLRAKSLADHYLAELAADRHRNELIGRPFKMFANPVWLQGAPIEAADLAGKVVVFSFWSMSGPSKQLGMDQLNQWQRDYAADGLIVIGISRRGSSDWDDQAKQTKYVAGLPPEKSDDAARKFLRHHGVEYRAAVVDDPAFAKEYGVKKLPQHVVIDRQGLIQRISLNLDDENGAAIEAEIRKSLGLGSTPANR